MLSSANYEKTILLIIFLSSVLFCTAQINTKNKAKYINKTQGFGILYRLPGIWSGPVTTTTSAGNFDNWFVDMRPVSKSQISQFSLLDANTVNNYSIFVAEFQGEKRIALRTEGCFANSCCITYEVLDSVNEAEGYYRFSDFIGGPQRAHTEFIFTENSMTMQVYTNKFNKESGPVLHSTWEAIRHDSEDAYKSCKKLKFPKPKPVVDLTNGFPNKTESIFFEFDTDPYNAEAQPIIGKLDVSIKCNDEFNVTESDEILILLTVQPLFDGIYYLAENFMYTSKSVYLPGTTGDFTINNVHSGEYFVYVFVDRDEDKLYKSGDLMSDSLEVLKVIVKPGETTFCEIIVPYLIP